MKSFSRILAVAGLAAAAMLGSMSLAIAQDDGGGNDGGGGYMLSLPSDIDTNFDLFLGAGDSIAMPLHHTLPTFLVSDVCLLGGEGGGDGPDTDPNPDPDPNPNPGGGETTGLTFLGLDNCAVAGHLRL